MREQVYGGPDPFPRRTFISQEPSELERKTVAERLQLTDQEEVEGILFADQAALYDLGTPGSTYSADR